MKKYLVEFIGTFFLTLTIATAAVYGTAGTLAPFAIAAVLMVMIYAGGPVSGAHYNPAVTLAVFIRGRCPARDVARYLLAQLIAAILAAFTAKALVTIPPELMALVNKPLTLNTAPTLLAEFLFTFALVFVILHVATSRAADGKSYFGLAIAGTVLAGALTVGSISGGAFNPAVTVMLQLLGKIHGADLWLHLLPQLLAAAIAARVFLILHPDER